MSDDNKTNLPPHLQQDMKIAAVDYSESLEIPVIEEIAAEDAFKAGGKAMYSFILQELEPVVEALRIARDKHEGMAMCLSKHGTNLNISFLINDCMSDVEMCDRALKHLKERVMP